MIARTFRHRHGYTVHASLPSRDDIRAAWRETTCDFYDSLTVTYLGLTEEQALCASAAFHRHFADLRCTKWDGTTLRLYVGQCGACDTETLRRQAHRCIQRAINDDLDDLEPLFGDAP